MSKCFWSYNYTLITTVQQHKNLQLIVASQVDQLWQHVVIHSSSICPHQQTTGKVFQIGTVCYTWPMSAHASQAFSIAHCTDSEDLPTTVAKYSFHRSRGDRQTEDLLAMDAALWTCHCPKSQDRDRDWDSRDPRPGPRPRLWGSKTKTETKTCKNGSRDVSRPRLKSRELQVWLGVMLFNASNACNTRKQLQSNRRRRCLRLLIESLQDSCQSTRHTVNSSQPKIVWRVDRRLKHRVVMSWPAVLSPLWRVDRSLLSA